MDCEIAFIYIAETQPSRMIMSSPPSVSVRAVQLEYLGRYMHQTLLLYFIVNYVIFHVLQ
jgi:hypothetical protein